MTGLFSRSWQERQPESDSSAGSDQRPEACSQAQPACCDPSSSWRSSQTGANLDDRRYRGVSVEHNWSFVLSLNRNLQYTNYILSIIKNPDPSVCSVQHAVPDSETQTGGCTRGVQRRPCPVGTQSLSADQQASWSCSRRGESDFGHWTLSWLTCPRFVFFHVCVRVQEKSRLIKMRNDWWVQRTVDDRHGCSFMNWVCDLSVFSQLILQQIYQLLSELEKNRGFHFMQREEDIERRRAAEKARSVCRKTGLHRHLSWLLILTSSFT